MGYWLLVIGNRKEGRGYRTGRALRGGCEWFRSFDGFVPLNSRIDSSPELPHGVDDRMKRRSLFTMIPAASALLAMRSQSAPAPLPGATAAGFTIAVQCWSFREFTCFEAIEMAAAAGAHVELFPGHKVGGAHGDLKLGPDLPEDVLASLADHLKKHGVAAVNFGVTPVPGDEAAARRLFGFVKRLGIPAITTESIREIDLIESLARESGIRVAFHNHPRPTALWHPDTIAKALDGRDALLGFCADTGHWATSGLDPLEVVRGIAPRLRSFHLKDRAEIGKWSHDRPFGTGSTDLVGILDAARAVGFDGNVSIEYEHNWESNLAEVAQCVGFLRAYSKVRAG